jgi:hypothetical protein
MKILIIHILLLLPILSFSQKVDGHISEKNNEGETTPLIGANVFWLGTTIGTTTNAEGYFLIDRPAGADRLIISFVGFNSDTLIVPKKQDTCNAYNEFKSFNRRGCSGWIVSRGTFR